MGKGGGIIHQYEYNRGQWEIEMESQTNKRIMEDNGKMRWNNTPIEISQRTMAFSLTTRINTIQDRLHFIPSPSFLPWIVRSI